MPSVTVMTVQGFTEMLNAQSSNETGMSALSDPGLVMVSSSSYDLLFSSSGSVTG